jgi:uncharacterized protein YndB with AHSA1/START domain
MTGKAPEAQLSKVSDAAIRERTGRGWDAWFALLDARGATGHTHTEITRWLGAEHKVDSWSMQAIAVGYEQERGLRAPGQGADGFFSASASKTVAVPVDRLYEAFTDASLRARWLSSDLEATTTVPAKTFRAVWDGGSTRIAAGFTAKGADKAQVALLHEKLPDAAAVAKLKAFWRERFDALKTLLEG